MTDQPMPPYPYYYPGRVPPRRVDCGFAMILLDYLSVGAICPESTLNRFKLRREAVGRDLRMIDDPTPEIG